MLDSEDSFDLDCTPLFSGQRKERSSTLLDSRVKRKVSKTYPSTTSIWVNVKNGSGEDKKSEGKTLVINLFSELIVI